MPVVSVQNLFFGEFLVTQLSGRHPHSHSVDCLQTFFRMVDKDLNLLMK
jgi:hypothetical protein